MSQTQSQATEASPSKQQILSQFPDPVHNTAQAVGDASRHTDARSIREYHGVPAYDPDAARYDHLLPNVLEYAWDCGTGRIAGGTDLLTTGKPGSGKSTFGNHLVTRALGVNDAKAVWRASPSRSEWLPLAPWTTLCLPSGLPVQIQLEPQRPTEPSFEITLDELEEHIVREVRRYDSPRHLNEDVLQPGQLHVVYPDPLMRGCQDAYERSPEKRYDAPPDRPLFHESDPSLHWWFGWVLDRIESGPHDWTTLILDEIGDIAPQSAKKDSYGSYQKVELLQDCWVDARKKGLSIYSFGHSETDIHQMIRHKLRWRVSMNSTANPTSKGSVVGFDAVPMNYDVCSSLDVGEALIFNEQNFEKISWPNYAIPPDYKLELSVGGGR
jgi:hypothetical protein